MNTFWRPGRGVLPAVLWCRCDWCGWSGPNERFDWWYRNGQKASICDHYWCRRDELLSSVLLADGWQRDKPE